MDMANSQGKKRLIIISIIAGLAVLLIAGFLIFQNTGKTPVADSKTTEPATSTEAASDSPATETPKTDTPETTEVDESTLGSIDIEALGLTVFYTKGIPGFEYTIERTSDKTQYVQFTSPELVGTKCTDDKGIFASIVMNPTSEEDKTTISSTRKVGDNTYGLSLPSDNCTKDVELLKSYQKAFTNGFSRLKEL